MPYCWSQAEPGLLLLADKGILIQRKRLRERKREVKMAGKLPEAVWSWKACVEGAFKWRLQEWVWVGQAKNEREKVLGRGSSTFNSPVVRKNSMLSGNWKGPGCLSGVCEEQVVYKEAVEGDTRPCWSCGACWPHGTDFFHNWISSLCKVLSRSVGSVYSLKDHCQLTRDSEREMRMKSRKTCRRLQQSSRQEIIMVCSRIGAAKCGQS